MGNSPDPQNPYASQQWQVVSTAQATRVLKSVRTGHTVRRQQYQSTESPNQGMIWRQNNQSLSIPRILYWSSHRDLLGNVVTTVYTQELTPLCDIPNLSKAEGFLILLEVLSALPALISRVGYFHPSVHSIFVSNTGRCSVWVHQNLACNAPDPDDTISTPSQHPQMLIYNNLVRLVKSKINNSHEGPSFPNATTLQDAITQIALMRQNNPSLLIERVYVDRDEFMRCQNRARIQTLPNPVAPPHLRARPMTVPVQPMQSPVKKAVIVPQNHQLTQSPVQQRAMNIQIPQKSPIRQQTKQQPKGGLQTTEQVQDYNVELVQSVYLRQPR